MRYHLSAQHLKNAFLYRSICHIPSLNFSVPLAVRNQLAPRSLLRFEVPGSANKAVICRAGCCVAVCHVPRRHEIAFRSKRAKMAREERITCVCVCVCTSVCVNGGCDACTSHGVFVYTANIRASACVSGPRNGRRNCAWITPTARFAPWRLACLCKSVRKKMRKKEKNKTPVDRLASVIVCAALALCSRFVADCISLYVIDARTFVRHLLCALPAIQNLPSEREREWERERARERIIKRERIVYVHAVITTYIFYF